jgi:hypothetical protein
MHAGVLRPRAREKDGEGGGATGARRALDCWFAGNGKELACAASRLRGTRVVAPPAGPPRRRRSGVAGGGPASAGVSGDRAAAGGLLPRQVVRTPSSCDGEIPTSARLRRCGRRCHTGDSRLRHLRCRRDGASNRMPGGVLCTVYCVLCTVYCVLCTVYCVVLLLPPRAKAPAFVQGIVR